MNDDIKRPTVGSISWSNDTVYLLNQILYELRLIRAALEKLGAKEAIDD